MDRDFIETGGAGSNSPERGRRWEKFDVAYFFFCYVPDRPKPRRSLRSPLRARFSEPSLVSLCPVHDAHEGLAARAATTLTTGQPVSY